MNHNISFGTTPSWLNAVEEHNWLIFAVLAPDEKGKKGKYPCLGSNPVWPCSIHKAAALTKAEADQFVDHYAAKPHLLERVNAQRVERDMPPIAELIIGYCPREGSALVVIDLDDCLDEHGELVDGHDLFAELALFGGWVEVSTGGRGLRVMMPRGEGDLEKAISNVEIGGVGVFARGGKGAAVTGNWWGGVKPEEIERSDALFDRALEVREQVRGARMSERRGSGDNALEEALHWGMWDCEAFLKRLEGTKNPEALDFNEWYGMILAAKEHFSLQAEVDLDALGEGLCAWSLKWENDENDGGEDKFWELWYRPLRDDASGRRTMASWDWLMDPEEEEKEAEKDVVPEDVGRWAVADGRFYDRRAARFRSADETLNMWKDVVLTDIKGKQVKARNSRHGILLERFPGFDELVFIPSEPLVIEDKRLSGADLIDEPGHRMLNTWEGVKSGGGAADPGPWLEHIKLCYPEDWEAVVDFCAWQVQRPGEKLGWALVLMGPQGSGKDTILMPILGALGRAANGGVPFKSLMSDFNEWPVGKSFVVFQEAHRMKGTEMRDIEERLKTTIAAPPMTLHVNPKGRPAHDIPNIVNIAITTNNMDGMHISVDDRRYFVAACHGVPGDAAYFANLWDWLGAGGHQSVTQWLLQRDIELGAGAAPQSSGRRLVQEEGLPSCLDVIRDQVAEVDWFVDRELVLPMDDDELMKLSPRRRATTLASVYEYLGFREYRNPENARGEWRFGELRGRVWTKEKHPLKDDIRDRLKSLST